MREWDPRVAPQPAQVLQLVLLQDEDAKAGEKRLARPKSWRGINLVLGLCIVNIREKRSSSCHYYIQAAAHRRVGDLHDVVVAEVKHFQLRKGEVFAIDLQPLFLLLVEHLLSMRTF